MAKWTAGSQQIFCSNDRVLSTPRNARFDLRSSGDGSCGGGYRDWRAKVTKSSPARDELSTCADERPWTPRRGKWVLSSLARRGESRQHSCQPPIRQIFLRSSDHRGACRRGLPGSRSLFPRLASRPSEMRFAPGRKALCSPCAPTAEGHASAKIASLKLTKPYPYGPGDTFDPTCASAPTRPAAGRSRARDLVYPQTLREFRLSTIAPLRSHGC